MNKKVQIIQIPKVNTFKIGWGETGRPLKEKQLKRIVRLDKNAVIPEFVLKAQENGKELDFDSALYSDTKNKEMARLTKNLGWSIRTGLWNKMNDYYRLKRMLKFREVQIIARDQIVKALNQFFEKNLNNAIVLETNATLEKVSDIRSELDSGKLSVQEVASLLDKMD
ncbi:MAG: hypothetical protein WCG20_01565 [bacterium]